MSYQILRGDCLAVLRTLPDASFDSIVTDPPYELGFMGKAWDASGIANNVEMWREALRVLKPGGHLLAFSGSRTYHRMTCAIEDAGFEVRDQIMWVYGSGFPKSLDVSKAIDKAAGAVRTKVRVDASDLKNPPNLVGGVNNGSDRPWRLAAMEAGYHEKDSDEPATDAARQWEGWGTALKPAHEPICVARKPLIGTVAANVLAHGTGALNIGACRVETSDNLNGGAYSETRQESNSEWAASGSLHESTGQQFVQPAGRWPANLIHDGSDEVLAAFPDAKGQQGAVTGNEPSAKMGATNCFGKMDRRHEAAPRVELDTSAARFFYCAKASKSDRGPGNTHPTVKPLALMRYLLRLVTPTGGRSLDIFAGSGSTIVAGLQEGFIMTGIELTPEYADIAESRAQEEYLGDLI